MFGRRQSDREFMRRLVEGDREFMRELVLRMERSEGIIVADLKESRRESSAAMTQLSEAMTEIKNELVEHRADQRASREALFRILDRLDRLGPGGATA